jgi:hypothetical protein
MATTNLDRAGGQRGKWTLLSLLLFLCFVAVAFPTFIIRPFVHQAAEPLKVALLVQRWAPWFTLIGLVAGLLVIIQLWRAKPRAIKKAFLLASAAGLGLCAWAARINVYERIFHPLGNALFIPAAQAGLRPEDMLMAVSINGDDRAYPVLQMAYHHLFNDVVGGVPILPTY